MRRQLLQWRVLQWLQQRGARVYNLHGIDPEANPGTYHFKAGLAGRASLDLRYLGSGEAAPPGPSRLLLAAADRLRRAWRDTRPTGPRLDAGR